VSVQRLSRLGICVSDLERSLRFYRDALGFNEESRLKVTGDDSARLLDIDGGNVEAVFLKRDGTCIELLFYPDAGCDGAGAPRPMNGAGLSHLAFRVEDLDQACLAVEQYGGKLLQSSRVENKHWGTRVIFATDPDGLRLELLQAPGDPDNLPGT